MKNWKTTISLLAASVPAVVLAAQVLAQSDTPKAETKAELPADFLSLSKVEWGALNPARGAAGPRAGNLWGDRFGEGTTGFLVKFTDGFSSPPHIHNVTYRGVVISGLVHNDDPDAAEMWMPPGSYWTQPAGEVHITAAKGENVMVYIEIESGPYRVMPPEEASDNGERPVNVDAANLVWLGADESTRVEKAGPEIAYLWENEKGDQGTLVKLPAGFSGTIVSDGSPLRAVVIKGQPTHRLSGEADSRNLDPGTYFGSEGEAMHQISSESDRESIIYVRTAGSFDIHPAAPAE